MKRLLNHFKPYDYLLIGIALLLTFTPWFVTAFERGQSTNETTKAPSSSSSQTSSHETEADDAPQEQEEEEQLVAIVTIDGEEVDRFLLGPNTGHEEKTYYPHSGQYNIVEKDNERIRVKEDNSPDQIAVRTGWIDRPGYISICLPHGLIIEIVGELPEAEDELILPMS